MTEANYEFIGMRRPSRAEQEMLLELLGLPAVAAPNLPLLQAKLVLTFDIEDEQ